MIAEKIRSGDIKKTGMSQYNYLELVDFITDAHLIFDEIGLLAVFEFGKEMAYLHIHDVDNPHEPITFQTPIIKATLAGKAPDPLKELGATQTYLRRYLWIQALELAVPDNVDAQMNYSQNQNTTLERIEL